MWFLGFKVKKVVKLIGNYQLKYSHSNYRVYNSNKETENTIYRDNNG